MAPCLALLVVIAAPIARAEPPAAPTLLHEVSVETTGTLPGQGFGRVRLSLFVSPDVAQKPNVLVERRAGKLRKDAIVVDTAPGAYSGGTDAAKPQQTSSSFLIDFDSPAFDALRTSLPDDAPTLRDFAARYIDKKNLSREYDSASVVAQRHEGDCTEHAVFLAALLRIRKIPARVVHGLVLLRVDGTARAFGHAWVEVRGRKGWTPLDAALDVDPTNKPIYLPLAVVENEGPGHSLDTMSKLEPTEILRVKVEAITASAGSARR